MELIEQVRAKVIEAVPEIETMSSLREIAHEKDLYKQRPITLADVLRATQEAEGFNYITIDSNGYMRRESVGTASYWNLALPLDEQEPEVIEFIAKVLNITS